MKSFRNAACRSTFSTSAATDVRPLKRERNWSVAVSKLCT
jgi:hypothetical protein